MLPDNLLINRPAPAEISSLAEKQFEDSQPLFAVVSDLDINSDYGSGAVYVSADKIVAVGGGIAGDCISLDFASIDEITVKRMYGNAVLKVKTVGGSTMDILRFTFACADVCDAAADFVTKLKRARASRADLPPLKRSIATRARFARGAAGSSPIPVRNVSIAAARASSCRR